jgi:hypothetical protein
VPSLQIDQQSILDKLQLLVPDERDPCSQVDCSTRNGILSWLEEEALGPDTSATVWFRLDLVTFRSEIIDSDKFWPDSLTLDSGSDDGNKFWPDSAAFSSEGFSADLFLKPMSLRLGLPRVLLFKESI